MVTGVVIQLVLNLVEPRDLCSNTTPSELLTWTINNKVSVITRAVN